LLHRRRTFIALRRAGLVLTAGLTLGAGVLTGAGAGWAGPPATAAATTADGSHQHTVTLLTGDRVTVTSAAAATGAVTPAKGREHIRFATFRSGGHLYVLPQDATRLVQTGRLDRRLFDISALVNFGYDDASRSSLPLIIGYAGGTARPAASTLAAAGARVTRDLPDVNGAAMLADKAKASAVWSTVTSAPDSAGANLAGGVERIWLDGRRQPALDQSVPQIGAPIAWQAGYTGKGVTVAVLDTGIDATHPDLAGKVVEAQNFSADPNATDGVGHGTHVASTIAGTGAASGGRYKGVAPDAKLYSGKVCELFGCSESAILAGMQWAAADKHARVVNLSLGSTDGPEIDPLEQAVNTLTAQYGTLFVIAAGNSGPDNASVGSPGSADAALTVGAVDKSDGLAVFSSRGPRVGDDALKPDITAPGVDIVAARAAGTQPGDPVGDSYVRLSGTSMATPHVVGSAAILAQQHPDWVAGQLKADLLASAKPNPQLTGYQQGAGRVDVARAISQPVTTDPVSLSLGRQTWPHGDDQPIVRTLTYQNSGATELTLNLAVKVTGPDGKPAPAGMFTTSASQVTVPAGGKAEVTLTADTRVAGPDGLYSGQIIATSGPTQVSTAIGVNKEVESYDVTLTHIDRTGAAASNYFTVLTGMDKSFVAIPYSATGTAKIRIPKGRYDLFTFLFTESGPGRAVSLLAQPVLDVSRDTSVTLDARQAGPVSMTVPDASARPALVDAGYDHRTQFGTTGAGVIGDSFDGIYLGHLGAAASRTEYLAHVASQWAKPDANGRLNNSPYLYSVAAFQYGQVPNGFTRRYRDRELAVVHAEHGAVLPGQIGSKMAFWTSPLGTGGWARALNVALPSQRTEYYSTDGAVWYDILDMGTPGSDGFLDINSSLESSPTGYRAGRHYQDQWNAGPFGPAFPQSIYPPNHITRQGDTLIDFAPLFSDGAGHAGSARTDTASTTLYRNGTQVGQTNGTGGVFPVPADTSSYRLVTEATRSGYTDLATSVRTDWTFRSGHVSGTDYAKLPVMAVRFTPKLEGNGAPAGRLFQIPVTVQEQYGAPPTRVRPISVDVSYDDGKTWQAAPLRPGIEGWVATVAHPASGGYVSLRAKAVDSAGNTVEQTVIHAYRLTAH
jgi:subtilisin family serine protease